MNLIVCLFEGERICGDAFDKFPWVVLFVEPGAAFVFCKTIVEYWRPGTVVVVVVVVVVELLLDVGYEKCDALLMLGCEEADDGAELWFDFEFDKTLGDWCMTPDGFFGEVTYVVWDEDPWFAPEFDLKSNV